MEHNFEKMLQLCIHDYLIQRGMHEAAEVFVQETGLQFDGFEINPGIDFFLDWWHMFYGTYMSRSSANPRQNSVAEPAHTTPNQQLPVSFPGSSGSSSFTNPNLWLVNADNFTVQNPVLSNSSSSWNQMCLLPQELLATYQNFIAGSGRLNPLNSGTFGMLSSYGLNFSGDGVGSSSMLPSGLPLTDQNICVGLGRLNPQNFSTQRNLNSIQPTAGLNSYANEVGSSSRSLINSSPAGGNADINNGATYDFMALKEFSTMKPQIGQLICCDFSSDGEILACIGRHMPVLLWKIKTNEYIGRPEMRFPRTFTDARFVPGSSYVAACSTDKTVELWDANDPNESLLTLFPYEPVASMDFNPKNNDELYTADNYEIRIWSVSRCSSEVFSKEATRKMAFQRRDGRVLAASMHNKISLFDVESKLPITDLYHGHEKPVHSICWDACGNYIATVSEDQARIWSFFYNKIPVYEIQSNGKKIESCTFHPNFAQAFVLGSNQSLEVWNPSLSNNTVSVNAHSGPVSGLCASLKSELIASSSNDNFVKLWKK